MIITMFRWLPVWRPKKTKSETKFSDSQNIQGALCFRKIHGVEIKNDTFSKIFLKTYYIKYIINQWINKLIDMLVIFFFFSVAKWWSSQNDAHPRTQGGPINDMGQKPSHQLGGGINKKLPFSLFLRGHQTTHNPNPEQPIRFQYKTRRKSRDLQDSKHSTQNAVNNNIQTINNLSKQNQSNIYNVKNTNAEVKCKLVKTQNAPLRTKSEPNLVPERNRERHRHRRKPGRIKSDWSDDVQQFGYEIQDVDAFLTKVSSFVYVLQNSNAGNTYKVDLRRRSKE